MSITGYTFAFIKSVSGGRPNVSVVTNNVLCTLKFAEGRSQIFSSLTHTR